MTAAREVELPVSALPVTTSSGCKRGNVVGCSRVLVVDDDAAMVGMLQCSLAKAGYDVISSLHPNEALALLRDERFELMLVDLHMPEMDGITFLRAAFEIDRHVMGILMTGCDSTDTAIAAMKAGAFDYLVKPFEWKAISPVLSRALGVRQLRLNNEGLERRLHARTAEVEAANKELEAFAYSVSHDLQAPLRAISAFNELIADEWETGSKEKIRDYTNRVQRNVQRMSTLIEDLLRLGKTAQAEMRREPVDLSDIVREIAAKLHAQGGARTATWGIEPNLLVRGDPGLLRIVMENLLSNAWKYTGKMERAKIEVGGENQPNGERVFYVRDNGIGFDPAQAGRLFTPFHRLHAEAEFAGTGVGLATVQRIVAKHGGRIWAAAAPGKGATFHFTLP